MALGSEASYTTENECQRSEGVPLRGKLVVRLRYWLHFNVCLWVWLCVNHSAMVLQDIGVGKSSLVGRFVHNSFNPNLTTTLG